MPGPLANFTPSGAPVSGKLRCTLRRCMDLWLFNALMGTGGPFGGSGVNMLAFFTSFRELAGRAADSWARVFARLNGFTAGAVDARLASDSDLFIALLLVVRCAGWWAVCAISHARPRYSVRG